MQFLIESYIFFTVEYCKSSSFAVWDTERFLLKWDSTLRNRVRLIRLPLRILFLLIDAW